MSAESPDEHLAKVREQWVMAWRTRQAKAFDADAGWRKARRAEALRAAHALLQLPGVRRVILFGSLARGEATCASDVDLYLEGLTESAWLDAVRVAYAHIAHADIDLVRAEVASASLRARVEAEGVVLGAQ